MTSHDSSIGWLLDSDVSIRWQVMRDAAGEPSRWVTLRAMRVLRWWEGFE